MMDDEPRNESSLLFGCGCTERWKPPEEPITTVDLTCLSDCHQCTRDGLCMTRRALPPHCGPLSMSDIAVGGPKKYRRMAASA